MESKTIVAQLIAHSLLIMRMSQMILLITQIQRGNVTHQLDNRLHRAQILLADIIKVCAVM